jgi:hypothetical protein
MSKVVSDPGPDIKTLVLGPGLKFLFDWDRIGTGPGPKFFLTEIETGTDTKIF